MFLFVSYPVCVFFFFLRYGESHKKVTKPLLWKRLLERLGQAYKPLESHLSYLILYASGVMAL